MDDADDAPLSEREAARQDEQRRYVAQAAGRLLLGRHNRLQRLEQRWPANTESYQWAKQAMADLLGTKPVRITKSTVRAPQEFLPDWVPPDPESYDELHDGGDLLPPRDRRPPTSRLLGHGHALSYYLAMLAVAGAQFEPGKVPQWPQAGRASVSSGYGGAAWLRIFGLSHILDSRTRTDRNRRLMTALSGQKLLSRRPRSRLFTLLDPYEPANPYRVPNAGEALLLPAEFFTNGWYLVLEPQEIAMWLAIQEHPGWTHLDERRYLYGISGETYRTNDELVEFGLVERWDAMPFRRRGRVSAGLRVSTTDNTRYRHGFVYYEFAPHNAGLALDAREHVSACLRDGLPLRFGGQSELAHQAEAPPKQMFMLDDEAGPLAEPDQL